VPLLVEAREVIAAFQAMIRKKSLADLEPWLERARSGLVTSFANGVAKDRAAVSAAITSPWSNGQTEGQSPNSSSLSARCTVVENSTYFRPASSAPDRPFTTKIASEPLFHADPQIRTRFARGSLFMPLLSELIA